MKSRIMTVYPSGYQINLTLTEYSILSSNSGKKVRKTMSYFNINISFFNHRPRCVVLVACGAGIKEYFCVVVDPDREPRILRNCTCRVVPH